MPKKYKSPLLAVDIIIEDNDKIVLIKRKNEPFKGMWAIPGGFVEYGETVEAAAIREAKEETNLNIKLKKLLGVYSDPTRDPRGHVISVVFIAKKISGKLHAKDDAIEVKKFELKDIDIQRLAFDHNKIIADYVNYVKEGLGGKGKGVKNKKNVSAGL